MRLIGLLKVVKGDKDQVRKLWKHDIKTIKYYIYRYKEVAFLSHKTSGLDLYVGRKMDKYEVDKLRRQGEVIAEYL